MLLDEALKRSIGDARGIETRSFRARVIGATAAQRVKAIAGSTSSAPISARVNGVHPAGLRFYTVGEPISGVIPV